MKESTQKLFKKLFYRLSEKYKLLIRGWLHDIDYERKDLINNGKMIQCIIQASDILKIAPFELVEFIIQDAQDHQLMSFLPYIVPSNINYGRELCKEFKPYLKKEKKRIESIASLKQYWKHNKVSKKLIDLQTKFFIECFE